MYYISHKKFDEKSQENFDEGVKNQKKHCEKIELYLEKEEFLES